MLVGGDGFFSVVVEIIFIPAFAVVMDGENAYEQAEGDEKDEGEIF